MVASAHEWQIVRLRCCEFADSPRLPTVVWELLRYRKAALAPRCASWQGRQCQTLVDGEDLCVNGCLGLNQRRF